MFVSLPSQRTLTRCVGKDDCSKKGILYMYETTLINRFRQTSNLYFTYVLCKIEFSTPLKPSSIQATCAFFSPHGVLTDSAAIVPHTPFIHISTLPELVRSIEVVCVNRISPLGEQL